MPNISQNVIYTATDFYQLAEQAGVPVISLPLPQLGSIALQDGSKGVIGIDSTRVMPSGEEQAVLEQEFSGFESQSIDYGIMEKAEHIYIIPGSFGWDDVGSWLAVERIQKADENGNVIQGNIAAVDTKNCVLQGGSKLIAAVGLEDIVIVDTEDATLVCAKNDTNNIKKIIEHLKNCKKEKYI